ncbi:MAG: hypothetical protein M3R51_09310 [Candidatus Eremiobacteraeota bacterium]|nr:hypothetical protein [Candidatus Eremiobacteraeota bacterium]
MAHISYDYKIVRGKPDETLAEELGDLSASGGWNVAEVASIGSDLIVLLKREKDYEVAQSLQEAFAQPITAADAISRTAVE